MLSGVKSAQAHCASQRFQLSYRPSNYWQQCLCHPFSLKEGEDQKEITIEPPQALDEVEPLPEDCYTRPISLPEGMLAPDSPKRLSHFVSLW